MLDDLLGTIIGSTVGEIIGHAIKSPFIRAKQGRGMMRAALRLESGAQNGITASWRRGNVRLSPGMIEFNGAGVRVVSVARAPRPPDLNEWVRVHTDSLIFIVVTPTARVLWAIPSAQSAWALQRVARTDGESGEEAPNPGSRER